MNRPRVAGFEVTGDNFVTEDEMPDKTNLHLEWRIYKQLSPRMIKCYRHFAIDTPVSPAQEWVLRAHLIVDYVSGLTDASARDFYQNYMGISL